MYRNPTLKQVKRIIKSSPFLSYDIESLPDKSGEEHTGLDPTRARLRMIGLGNTEEAFAYYWFRNDKEIEAEIKRALEAPRKIKVAINEIWFDDRVLKRYKILPTNVVGLREMRRSMSSTSPLSLAYITSIHTDAPPWKEGEEDDDTGVVFTKSIKKLAKYNCQDVIYTARDYEDMVKEPEWKTPRVQELYCAHRELARIAAEMHSNGFKVHEENRQFMAWCLSKEKKEKTKEIQKRLGLRKDWKAGANSMRALIFKKYAKPKEFSFGLDDPQDPKMWTEDGLIKVDKATLIKLFIDPLTPPELKNIFELYWGADTPQRWISTFLLGKKVQHAIGPDGRLRAGWNSCGTDTMRFSCSKPNLMNLPQILRAMYTVEKGNVLVHADKSQMELWMMAAVSGDPVLLRNLKTGDVYSEDAKDWFGCSECGGGKQQCPVCLGNSVPRSANVKDAYPKQRRGSKEVHLAKQYGASDKTVWASCLKRDRGFKWGATVILCRKFEETYKGTVEYWDREYKRAAEAGYSEGRLLGSRRYYPRLPERSEVVNYPIQTTAAEMMNLELIALDKDLKRYIPSAKLVTQLHDAVDVECRAKDAKLCCELVEKNMGGHKEYLIEGRRATFPIEIKVAHNNWSEV